MPISGNTDVLGENCRGKMNRSRPTHYGIDMSLHYAVCIGLNRPTTVDVIQYLAKERWIQCFSSKNANVKSVLDQMNHKLH